MSLAGQRIDESRYQLIPRTLTFLLDGDRILLLELARSRGRWGGKYNGVGGHIERGEDPLGSAQREIREETGLRSTDLRLCGVAAIDGHDHVGIGLYIFVGQAAEGTLRRTEEGSPRWVRRGELEALPLVEDLRVILPKALDTFERGQAPFSAVYRYDDDGELSIQLREK